VGQSAPVAVQPVAPQPVAPQPVAPQPANGSPASPQPSGDGSVTLAADFTPDPYTATGSAGGPVDASTMNPACRGFVSAQPNQTLMASTAFANLRILVNGGHQDATLMVQKPDGSFVCDDDSEGRHPIVQFQTTPGLHRVWIGSYQPGVELPYVLGISELSSVTTSTIGAPPGTTNAPAGVTHLDTSASQSNFGTITLRSGFEPDPHITEGTSGAAAGNDIDALQIDPRCRGHITGTPDHLFVAGDDFSSLSIAARSDGDTTLVVRMPGGTFLCDDDGGSSRNPMVQGRFPAGTYSIWVGSYSSDSNFSYRLGFSERQGFNSGKL
jgi:serine protease Do